jgi:hypothetical protein
MTRRAGTISAAALAIRLNTSVRTARRVWAEPRPQFEKRSFSRQRPWKPRGSRGGHGIAAQGPADRERHMAMNKIYRRVPRNVLSEQEDQYCQACVLNGGNGSEAVAKAWPHTTKWKAQARAEKSAKLQRKDKIRARIAELQEVAKQKANEVFCMSAEELLYRLTLIGRASIADYMQLDKIGQLTIAFDSATPAQMYALQECSVDDIETRRGRGKRTKIKLTDRISALKLIGQQHGMFKTETAVNASTPIPVVLSPAEQLL